MNPAAILFSFYTGSCILCFVGYFIQKKWIAENMVADGIVEYEDVPPMLLLTLTEVKSIVGYSLIPFYNFYTFFVNIVLFKHNYRKFKEQFYVETAKEE